MARGRTLQQAVEEAIRRAKAATLSENYVIQALSCAEAEAAEEEEALAERIECEAQTFRRSRWNNCS